MNDVVTGLGEIARFDCRVAAHPDPVITWLKDGHKIVPSDRLMLQNFHDDIFSLLIKDVQSYDCGLYACLAQNEYGQAKSESQLNVFVSKVKEGDKVIPTFLAKFGNVDCVEGVPVEFSCQIQGVPPPVVSWRINGDQVGSSLDMLTRQQGNSLMLAIRSVQIENSGEVICKIKNDLGEAVCSTKLQVNEDPYKLGVCPVIVERLNNIEVVEGDEAIFDCEIIGYPEPEVVWYFNGKELFDSDHHFIEKTDTKYQVIIKEVIPGNAGVYTCKAINEAGDAFSAAELFVKELPRELVTGRGLDTGHSFPPTFVQRLRDKSISPRRTARFECQMLGNPQPVIQWQKDGKRLVPDRKIRFGHEASTVILEIDDVNSDDGGEYACILSNDAGMATSRARLAVIDEHVTSPVLQKRVKFMDPYISPSRHVTRSLSKVKDSDLSPVVYHDANKCSYEERTPVMPFDRPCLLNIRQNSVKVRWLSAQTKGLPENALNISYVVEARESLAERWVCLASGIVETVYEARYLHPEKSYMFRVYAENKYGRSEVTLPATLQARREPKVMHNATSDEELSVMPHFPTFKPFVMDIGDETVRIGWHPAQTSHYKGALSPPVTYRVEAQKLPCEDWTPIASHIRDTSLYLSDLEPTHDYNMRVRYHGRFGASEPTSALWLPHAKGYSGVPVSRPEITDLEPGSLHLRWQRVDIPSFSCRQDLLTYMVEVQEPPSYHWRNIAEKICDTTYAIRNLKPDIDYRFRVRADTAKGVRSEPSPATSVHRTLALTRSFINKFDITDYEPEDEAVLLSWRRVEVPRFDSSEEPLLYMIESHEPLMDSWRRLVTGIPTTHYRVTDVGQDDDRSFRVRALTPYGVGAPSLSARLRRNISPCRSLSPDICINNSYPGNMRLSRQPSSPPTPTRLPALSYQVETLEHPDIQWRPLTSGIDETSFQPSRLSPSKECSHRVRSVVSAGAIPEPARPVSLTDLEVRPCFSSNDLRFTELGSDSVHLHWTKAELPYCTKQTSSIFYSIEMQELPSYQWTMVKRHIPETSYLITNLKSDHDYRFRVRPECDFSAGNFSSPIHIYRKYAISLPANEPRVSDVRSNSATLHWMPATCSAGESSRSCVTYRVEMREALVGPWTVLAEFISATHYTLNFLNPDNDYQFRVVAQADSVESEPTSSAYLPHRIGPPRMLPEPPYIFDIKENSVQISWRSVDIPTRITDYTPVTYRIEAQQPPLSEWRPISRHIRSTEHHLTGLCPRQDYNFRVRAENYIGVSNPTPVVYLRKRSELPVISDTEPIISDVTATSLMLSWQPAAATSFLLESVPVTYTLHYQRLPDLEWYPLARRVSGTSYYVTGLSPTSSYAFRVQAENQFGCSKPSKPASLPCFSESAKDVCSPQLDVSDPLLPNLTWKMPLVSQGRARKATFAVESFEPTTWTWRPLVSNLLMPKYCLPELSSMHDYMFRVRTEGGMTPSRTSFPISYPMSQAFHTASVGRPILSEIESDSVRVSWRPLQILPESCFTRTTSQSADMKNVYSLEMKELPYGLWKSFVRQTSRCVHEVTGLSPDSDYAFRVKTIGDDGDVSSFSSQAFLYRKYALPNVHLERPQLDGTDDASVVLRWNRVNIPAYSADEEPLSFMIEAQRLPHLDWNPISRGITDYSYKVQNLKPQDDYAFRIRGETPSGATSKPVSVLMYRRPEKAGVPIRRVTVDDYNVPPYSARISWKPVYFSPYMVPSDNKYHVEMKEPSKLDWKVVGRDVVGTHYLVPDLTPHKSYLFRIRAKSPAGQLSKPSIPVPFCPLSCMHKGPTDNELYVSGQTFPVSSRPYIASLTVKVPPRMPIDKPGMSIISPSVVHLTWKSARVSPKTSDLSPTTYRVEVRVDETFNWVEHVSGATDLYADIENLNIVFDYAFRVRAVNDFGWSKTTLPVYLHRPKVSSLDSIGLSLPPADMYEHDRKLPVATTKDTTKFVEVCNGDQVLCSDHKPIYGVPARVRNEDEFGEMCTPATSLCAKSSPPRSPSRRPTLTDVTDVSAMLTWPASRLPVYLKDKHVDYIIECRKGSDLHWSSVADNVIETFYQITWLNPKEDYAFRVRARNDSGISEPTLPVILERITEVLAHHPVHYCGSHRFGDCDNFHQSSTSRKNSGHRFHERVFENRDIEAYDLEKLPSFSENVSSCAPVLSNFDGGNTKYGLESRPLMISLKFRGQPFPNIMWYMNDCPLQMDDHHDSTTANGEVRLKFLNLNLSDIGAYTCRAENELGCAEEVVHVDVADPPMFLEPMQDTTVKNYGQCCVSCSVDGIPYPDVRFMKEWRPLSELSRFTVQQSLDDIHKWTLTIDNAISADAGTYMCAAENVAGKAYCSGRITVGESVQQESVYFRESCFEDDYYVLEEIGRGQVGRVHRVTEKNTGLEYAAKFIRVQKSEDKDLFFSELEMLLCQTHPSIVSVHDAYETPRQLIIVMEIIVGFLSLGYVKDGLTSASCSLSFGSLTGGELLDFVALEDDWTELRTFNVILKLLKILQHIHSNGVVHMDVTPSNLLLSGTSVSTLKLIDFGFACKLHSCDEIVMVHGSPGYVCPEVLEGSPISTACDVWAVGILAHILLFGQLPFDMSIDVTSFDSCDFCSMVSNEAKDFLSNVLQKDPKNRLSIEECISHPWFRMDDKGCQLDTKLIKNFIENERKMVDLSPCILLVFGTSDDAKVFENVRLCMRQSTAVKTVALVETLQDVISCPEKHVKGIQPSVNSTTGRVSFPEYDSYGKFSDSLSCDRVIPEKKLSDVDLEEFNQSLNRELQWLGDMLLAESASGICAQDVTCTSQLSPTLDMKEGRESMAVFRQRLRDLTFEEGDAITLHCAIDSSSPYSTVWYKNEELLTEDSRAIQHLSDDGLATLTITNAKPYDADIYRCVVRSKAGRLSTSMKLLLGDVPGRPSRPAVSQVAGRQMVVIWEAPHFEENRPILCYNVDYKAKGAVRWKMSVCATLEMCVVDGLEPNTPYRFRVSAANLHGRGAFSWPSCERCTLDEDSVISSIDDFSLTYLKRHQFHRMELETNQKLLSSNEILLPVVCNPVSVQSCEPNTEYIFCNTIFSGHYGELRECTNRKTSRRCIAKSTSTSIADYRHEYEILRALSHETISNLLSAFSAELAFCLIFEEFPGGHVAQRFSTYRRYSEDSVVCVIRQVLCGLQYLHRKRIAHLNLQPSSVVTAALDGLRVKLMDFSLAQVFPPSVDQVTVPLRGYPDFTAPEVIAKGTAVCASDIWAVGSLSFLLITGGLPFVGASVLDTVTNVVYGRYDVYSLPDGVSVDFLKFMFATMKLIPGNRLSVQECLDHKWIQASDAMIKSREATLLSSHHLRQFVMAYDAQRQCNEQCLENQNFIFPIVVPDLPLRESSLPSDSVGKEDDTTISESDDVAGLSTFFTDP